MYGPSNWISLNPIVEIAGLEDASLFEAAFNYFDLNSFVVQGCRLYRGGWHEHSTLRPLWISNVFEIRVNVQIIRLWAISGLPLILLTHITLVGIIHCLLKIFELILPKFGVVHLANRTLAFHSIALLWRIHSGCCTRIHWRIGIVIVLVTLSTVDVVVLHTLLQFIVCPAVYIRSIL